MVGHENPLSVSRGSYGARLPSRGSGANAFVGTDHNSDESKKVSKRLPLISAASQQRSTRTAEAPKNPLALLPSESQATATRNGAQEKWRSALLECEVALKELVTNSIDDPPTESRVMRTFQLYDAVSLIVEDHSPDLAQLLKMFRLEFCRAIFPRQSVNGDVILPWENMGDVGENLEGIEMTYFDRMDALLRENAALQVEVDLGNTRENLLQLKRQIAHLTAMVSTYESEVSRLERENERSAESYRKLRDELEEERRHNRKMTEVFDDEKQRLLQDCKDMQLRLCRLRKLLGDRESTVIKDTYMYMKTRKMGVMTRLFDEGDERVSILVMLSQLESRVNESLDEYDKEVLVCEEAELPLLRKHMLKFVSVLLEEMHLCEERYLRLLPHKYMTAGEEREERDETDGYVSLMSDPRLYNALVSRVAVHERNTSAAAAAAASPSPSPSPPLAESESATGTTTTTTPALGTELEINTTVKIGTPTMELKPKVKKDRRGSVNVVMSPLRQKESEPHSALASPSTDPVSAQSRAAQVAFSPSREEKKKEEEEEQQQQQTHESAEKEKLYALSLRLKQKEALAEAFSLVREKQEDWVTGIFGTAVETTDLLKRLQEHASGSEHITDHERLMQHFISHPMLDISDNKFQCGIDVYAGPGPLTQAFLCSITHVDPVAPLHVPQGTNFLHVKYRNPLRQEAVREDPEAAENVPLTSTYDVLDEWGGRTCFLRDGEQPPLPDLVNNSTVFNGLRRPSATTGATAASSSTPTATVFERLNPLSPNRSPEWLLYQSLFGGYRPLTPRLIDISYIDHILLNACESHFDRTEERYARCLRQAHSRATNSQMTRNIAERFFKDSYTLTDFQESIVRELESRYCYPELVAKALYEILCFLDASASSQPLVDLYLSCIRGFESPTRIHYVTFVMYQLTTNWPSSNPEEPVQKDDVLTLLEFIYKKASRVTSMDASEILMEYQMATRAAPITLNSLRHYLVTAILHYEDPLLLYFNGVLSYRATSSSVVEMNYDQFESALKNIVEEKIEGKMLIRYLNAACGFNKKSELTTKELACVATSMWSSKLWANM